MKYFLRKLVPAALIAGALLGATNGAVHADNSFPTQVHVASGERVHGRGLNVGVGRSVVINLAEDAADVLVSNPEVADAVMRTSRRIFLIGKKAGQARLTLFGRSGRELASFSVRVDTDTADLTRIIQKLMPGTRIYAEAVNGSVVLSGSAKSTLEAQQAASIAAKFAGAENTSDVVNLIAVEGKDQVQLKVTVAEVERSIIKQLGVRFSGSVGTGNFTPTFTNQPGYNVNSSITNRATAGFQFLSGSTSITAEIEALNREGVIKTLAEPTLTAISGENASFLAGGEFPIPVGADDGDLTLEFKKFGVGLDFTPVVLSDGRISLRVKTEVSELSNEGAIDIGGLSVSALKVRRAESTLELPSGGTMVMAGLLRETYSQTVEGVPGLMKLPILGALFKSRDFLKKQTELVVFATPYVVRPVAASKLQRPDKNLITPSDAETVFLNRLNKIYNPNMTADGTYHGQVGFIYK